MLPRRIQTTQRLSSRFLIQILGDRLLESSRGTLPSVGRFTCNSGVSGCIVRRGDIDDYIACSETHPTAVDAVLLWGDAQLVYEPDVSTA
jgi:hypothetical protein